MDPELLMERVKRWGGISGKREAERAVTATLEALREAMFDDEADALAQELPQGLAASMRAHRAGAVVNVDQLYHRAAKFEGTPVRIALEHVQAVCQALSSLLPRAVVERISRSLPNFATLFVVPDRASHSAPVGSPSARTIAEGRPGSAHPLSEARPGSEHPINEPGSPPLRARTIAEAKPGSAHPLSEARPGSEHPLSEAGPPRAKP
jgi:uncharacterized protein (DUF2267 family)